MSANPEPLAAILAEMRNEAKPFRVGGDLCSNVALPATVSIWADRIEAAAAREREAAEARQLNECVVVREEEASEWRKRLGNAAAMRHALGIVYDWILKAGNVHGYPDTEQKRRQLYDMMTKALSAPPRNCDRFASAEEAVAAFADHLRAWENAHGIHSEYPDHPVQVPAGAFAWLFAPAEGGDHA